MVQIKVCGLTSLADVEIVNKYLPDYVGFVFAPSKRQVSLEKAQQLAGALSEKIKKVGVFVNSPRSVVEEIAAACQLDILQFHGQELPADCQGYSQPVWKAFNIKDATSLDLIGKYDVAGVLTDSYLPGVLGGTGITFDWHLATKLGKTHFLILAGGLTIDNVQQAITSVAPAVVDISSGVEHNGKKNELKIRQFVKKVRQSR